MTYQPMKKSTFCLLTMGIALSHSACMELGDPAEPSDVRAEMSDTHAGLAPTDDHIDVDHVAESVARLADLTGQARHQRMW